MKDSFHQNIVVEETLIHYEVQIYVIIHSISSQLKLDVLFSLSLRKSKILPAFCSNSSDVVVVKIHF